MSMRPWFYDHYSLLTLTSRLLPSRLLLGIGYVYYYLGLCGCIVRCLLCIVYRQLYLYSYSPSAPDRMCIFAILYAPRRVK